MIGTEFIKGQGLGNQLLCYVTARAIAKKKNCEFGTASQELFAMNIHSDRGMYFLDVDLGVNITPDMKSSMNRIDEHEDRMYMGNSVHDLTHGCYVTGADKRLDDVEDNTLIYGNMQSEEYFGEYASELRDWLKVRPEYDNYEYSDDDICILNMRGGEYTGCPELYLSKKYWVDAMKHMRTINPKMRFVIVTEDVPAANKMFPDIEAHHFDMGRDYITVKNAHYLILSNSSFSIIPAYTSDTLKYAVAPMYWARHNVSDGYWASEQNIYSLFDYIDRKGNVHTADECRQLLAKYKERSGRYRTINVRPKGISKVLQIVKSKYILAIFWMGRIMRSLCRRLGMV